MSDINYKLDYLSETKQQIKKAIINKGVEVSDTDTFRSYADKINNISGGSSADIVEAIVDNSALPIEAGKKVVVADVQSTGQGAGAIMPFDIVPYNLNGNPYNGHTAKINGEYSLHFNVGSSSSVYPHMAYKQVNDHWEGKYISTNITGYPLPHHTINLLYEYYYEDMGSTGTYWNSISEQVETIEFDIPFRVHDLGYATRYFLTYDSKYLFAIHLNLSANTLTEGTTGFVGVYRIEENTSDGTIKAYQETEPVEFIMPRSVGRGCTSLNSHQLAILGHENSSSAYKRPALITYDESTKQIIIRANEPSFWGDYTSFYLIAFTKDWTLLRYSGQCRLYHGVIFEGAWTGANFSNNVPTYTQYYNGRLFSVATGSSSQTQWILKVPVDNPTPQAGDFETTTFDVSWFYGPYWLNDNEALYTSYWKYDATLCSRVLDMKTGERTDPDPIRVPTMILDDGTGYFFKSDTYITKGDSLLVILPVNGSYNNGTVLHTITRSSQPYPYQMLQPQGANSSNAGSYSRFGTLPMRYLDNGNGFIFQTYYYNTSVIGGTQRGWFFRRVDEDPIMLEWMAHRSLVVGQNKAYITPRNLSSTQYPLTVIDADGVRDYTPINAKNAPGVMFEFEDKLYLYQYRNNDTTYGGYNCCEIVLNDEDMTATYTQFDDGSIYSPMASYITQNSMSSNPYPISTYSSHYNQPVLTKDGKYFVGLAGNHTTHYTKIEKHESGYPILNVYEFPQQLKDLLYEQEILYFEAYYPSGFGIQLANGTFLLCEYEQGLDVDLTITEYKPTHKYTFNSYNQCLMHFTSHKHYWYFSAGTYWQTGSTLGYAGCGRREDLPSTYQKRIYSIKHDWHPADHVTGYLTGTYKEDENNNIIAEVKTLLG